MPFFTAGLLTHMLLSVVLYGDVRSSETLEPLAGSVIEVLGLTRVTVTDAGGHYRIVLPPGPHVVQVSRLGYQTRTIEILVAAETTADSSMRVDISLVPRPLRFQRLAVLGRAPHGLAASAFDGTREIGSRRVIAEDVRADPAIRDADMLQALGTNAVAMTPAAERSPALHVRGGSSDQNLILLDGAPVYSPYHVAGAPAILGPDVIADATLHAGVPPARLGGALSSIVELRTARPDSSRWHLRGESNTFGIRQTVSGPLPGTAGTILASGQRSLAALMRRSGQTATRTDYGSAFVRVAFPLGAGELGIVSLRSADRLEFDAIAQGEGGGGRTTDDRAATGYASAESPRHRFLWSAGTDAVTWRIVQRNVSLSARAWRSTFGSSSVWAADTAVDLGSRLAWGGASGEGEWSVRRVRITAGAGAERIRTRDVARFVTVQGAAIPPLFRDASTIPGFASLQAEWRNDGRWQISGGLRGAGAVGRPFALEPRAQVRFAPTAALAFTGGLSRTSQSIQSLRNEESIVGTIASAGLPHLGGRGAAPAHADQVSISVEATAGAHSTLTLDGYTRRLSNLLLVAPATSQPFATSRFERGSGRASGLLIEFSRDGERLRGSAAYAYTVSSRASPAMRYRPTFVATHGLLSALSYRPQRGTILRASFRWAAGRRASILEGALDWTPSQAGLRSSDLAGTPQSLVGPLAGERLGAFARGDLGIEHNWRAAAFGRASSLTGYLDVSNVLDRVNAVGVTLPDPTRAPVLIPSASRAVTVGLRWAY